MSKMNLLVDLKIFEDQKLNASSNSSLKNISWQGFNIQEQFTREAVIKAKTMKTLFSELNANFTLESDMTAQNPISTPIPSQESISITTEDDRQSITIPRRVIPKSLILSINRVLAFSDTDFEIEVKETETVITWINSFAIDGEQEVEIGDTINVFYNYTEFISAQELNSDLYFERATEDYRLLYLEASGRCKVVVNNIVEGDIYPVIVNGVKNPAYFLKSTKIDDIKIINENDEDVQVFVMIAR